MHMARVEVHGEGSSTSCYDSVVKYLLRSCRGRCVEKCACQPKKTAKKCPILHSGPLREECNHLLMEFMLLNVAVVSWMQAACH